MDKLKGKKTVLFLIDSLTRAGAERVTVNLVNNLDRRRFKPIVVCVNGLGGEENFRDELNIEPIIFDTGVKTFKNLVTKLPNIIRTIQSLRVIIKREDITLVQSSLEISDLYAAILKLSNPRLRLISVRHNMRPSRKRLLWRKINAFILRRADKIVCVSNAVSSFTQDHYKVPDYKLRTIYNSVNLKGINQAKPLSAKELRGLDAKKRMILLAVGRLVRQKNFLMLIDAFSEIKDDKAVLVIIGEGHNEAEIKAMIRDKGLEKRVILKGPTKDIFSYYKTAEIFVLPSRWEGLGIVFIEAMAAGIPVITTNIAPLNEFVEHNKTGMLVNSKKELTIAMQKLIDNERKRKQLGDAAKIEVTRRFSVQAMVNRYQEVYEELLDMAGP